jgi:hypothetical protein
MVDPWDEAIQELVRPGSRRGSLPTDLPIIGGNAQGPMAIEQPMRHYVEELERQLKRAAERQGRRSWPRKVWRSMRGDVRTS